MDFGFHAGAQREPPGHIMGEVRHDMTERKIVENEAEIVGLYKSGGELSEAVYDSSQAMRYIQELIDRLPDSGQYAVIVKKQNGRIQYIYQRVGSPI